MEEKSSSQIERFLTKCLQYTNKHMTPAAVDAPSLHTTPHHTTQPNSISRKSFNMQDKNKISFCIGAQEQIFFYHLIYQ